jgi:hypothetical protein
MVKTYWLAAAVVVGIALGLLLGRATSVSPEPPPASVLAPAVASPRPSVTLELVGETAGKDESATRRVTTRSLHAQFVREERDDSWAYPREAELESSMLTELSGGQFNKVRIECRTTLCEVALTAGDDAQVAALKKWFENMNEQWRISQSHRQLWLRLASFSHSVEGGSATVKITYERPEQFLQAPVGG